MSQHDYNIANATAANVRADINLALGAIATNNSGGTEPSVTYANQWWYDTTANILKIRSEADDAWISVAYLDQSSNTFRILDDTQVVNSGGTQVGIIGDQATATWETGTGTTESLVSPAKVKAAIDALAGSGVGDGQTWQDVSGSRVLNTSYQNTTGKPIMVAARISSSSTNAQFQVSDDNLTWIKVSESSNSGRTTAMIVPDNHYYRTNTALAVVEYWAELR